MTCENGRGSEVITTLTAIAKLFCLVKIIIMKTKFVFLNEAKFFIIILNYNYSNFLNTMSFFFPKTLSTILILNFHFLNIFMNNIFFHFLYIIVSFKIKYINKKIC